MSLSNFYEQIYIIHYRPLTERKEYLVSQFKELKIEDKVKWIDFYESEKDVSDIENTFNLSSKLLCVNNSHLFCYKDQIKNNYKNILIFEDDIDFGTLDIISYLNQASKEFIELDGDIAFLSDCCNQVRYMDLKPPQLLYHHPKYATRCCGAYIVNIRCTLKLIKLTSINFHAIDRMLDYLIPPIKIRCLWSGLPIKQGSETGKYKSEFIDLRDGEGNYIS
jgi:GR25 family glycosyltransferase involved in LPS biosynthesis